MKIKELLEESAHGGVGSLQIGVARALPDTFVFPSITNTDPYLQYRFGLALAAARAADQGLTKFDVSSAFGENLTVVARSDEEIETIRLAQKLDPRSGNSRQISTHKSTEAPDVNRQSPFKPKGSIQRKK
jgi:hypothetical protein